MPSRSHPGSNQHTHEDSEYAKNRFDMQLFCKQETAFIKNITFLTLYPSFSLPQ